MFNTIPKQGKITSCRVIREYLTHCVSNLNSRFHVRLLPARQAKFQCHSMHVRIKRNYKAIRADLSPNAHIHRATRPNYPPQEHTEPLAGRALVVVGNTVDAVEVGREGLHGRFIRPSHYHILHTLKILIQPV